MIGIILCGHGEFASGMTSALKLIGGAGLPAYEVVDFIGTDTTDDLDEKLYQAIHHLEACEGILIFCDLIGGSPFKSASTYKITHKNIEVIAGVNLPMLIEINMLRTIVTNQEELIKSALDIGKNMITHYVYQRYEEEESEDGI